MFLAKLDIYRLKNEFRYFIGIASKNKFKFKLTKSKREFFLNFILDAKYSFSLKKKQLFKYSLSKITCAALYFENNLENPRLYITDFLKLLKLNLI